MKPREMGTLSHGDGCCFDARQSDFPSNFPGMAAVWRERHTKFNYCMFVPSTVPMEALFGTIE
jgi:hypothetical protein